MIDSVLFNIINCEKVNKVFEEEINDEKSFFNLNEKQKRDILNELLNDEERELFKSYLLAMEDKMHFAYLPVKSYIFFLGIKFGMEIQRAFYEDGEN